MPMLLAYLATWEPYAFESLPVEKLSHLCYAFAVIRDGELDLPGAFSGDAAALAQQEAVMQQMLALRARNPALQILISVGGWSADGFSDAALTAESRAKLVASGLAFIRRYGLDGIDLDWEYPSNDMAGIRARPQDRQNFTLLLQEFRQALDAESRSAARPAARPYLLSIAAGAGQYYLDGVEIGPVAAACDFINLMTYDFYNGWATRAGHHANLYPPAHEPTADSAAGAVALYVANGVPREKLVLGCPFYGRSLQGVAAPGLGAAGQAGSNAAPGFAKIRPLLSDPRWQQQRDPVARAPWLYDGDTFISYEDEISIAEKGAFARAEGLAGAMFWELSEDDNQRLLTALHAALYAE
ncbi:glycoside hydrolase family 18 protein [Chitinibacter tainanensis]|uniref:glycoside hydrolase family 18 protein n=1 Tax=Chitinibacter tainanensis TaxID=230667 RepID=UPI00041900FC|nr:glycoside hydrolase family 18 protein [Chitinibacter tainanensis]